MIKYFLEIKNRLILILISGFFMFLVCYFYKEVLLFLITQPYYSFSNSLPYFIFTNATELFSVYIKIIGLFSIHVVFWYFLYHFFIFIGLAVFNYEYQYLTIIVKSMFFLWVCSVFILTYWLVPLTWTFFLNFQDKLIQQTVHFEARLSEYLEFYISVYYVSILYCQTFSIFAFFIFNIPNFKNNFKRYRKLYYYFFLIFATILSPPDLFSQVTIFLLLILLYEFLLIFLLFKVILKSKSKVSH